MRSFAQSFGVATCGLVTSILTALAVVTVSRMTDFDLFTFSIWVVVPVGAALTGFVAASGYYFGSLYFHKQPDWSLLLQMMVIAGLTQILIYYMGYRTLVLDDGRRVSELVPFGQYLDIILTSAHYRIGRAMADVGEVGSFGYWLAVFQFVGFLAGGLSIYSFLKAKAMCPTCNLYLRPLSKREKTFSDADAASSYYDRLFHYPVDSIEFASLIRTDAKSKIQQGAILIKTILHGCPKCKAQMIEEKVQVHNGKEWKNSDKLNRHVIIPDGVDLISVFRS